MFFPLAALSGAGEGFDTGALNAQKIRQNQVDAAGQAAAGNALMALFNSPIPGAQPIQPAAMAQPRPPVQASMQPAIPGGQAPMPASRPAAAPQMSTLPGAQPMASAPPASMTMPSGGMPGGPPLGAQQQPGGSLHMLDWRTVIQSVVKANPGVKDPRVIAAAVDRFMPIMNSQSQQEWRAVSLQLREQSEQIARQRLEMQQSQGQQRIDTANQRADIQREQGETRLAQGQQRIDTANKREARLASSAEVRQDQAWQRLDLAKQQLARQITQGNQRQLLGQWRAVLDAQHKRAQEIIQGGNINTNLTDEQKKMLADEQKTYEAEIKSMRAGESPSGGQPAAAKPEFDRAAAKKAGYTDAQIDEYLKTQGAQ